MRDKKGYLPAHVACSRHCSPEKLRMLMAVYPASLYETTNSGHTVLSLATSTATKSHPNYALIDELNLQMQQAHARSHHHLTTPLMAGSYSAHALVSSEESDASRGRLDSNDSDKSLPPRPAIFLDRHGRPMAVQHQQPQPYVAMQPPQQRPSRKRNYWDEKSPPPGAMQQGLTSLDPVDLLLHFSRNGSSRKAAARLKDVPSTSLHTPPDTFAEV
jgi:hypothetical protein